MASSASSHDILIRWKSQGAPEVEQGAAKIGSAFDAAAKKAASASAAIAAVGSKFKAAGTALTIGLTAPLVLIGKQSIDAASDLNEAMSAVNTVFGKTAIQVVQFSQTAASNLGQSQQAALSAASALGALFQGVGLNNQQMADFSDATLQAAADLASFYNVDPGQALDNIRSGLVGQSEPLRRFGILLSEDAVKAKGLALGLAAADGVMSEGAKVQARYALIMEQLGAAQGDFARTSGGLANQQRILTARLQDLRAEIGTYLLPYALRLTETISKLVGWFHDLTPEAKELAVKIGAIAAAAGPALVILGHMMELAPKIGAAIGLLTSGPLALLVGAVVGLGLAWKNNWFGIRDITRHIVEGLQQTFGRMMQFFQHAKDRGLDPLTAGFRTLIVVLGEKLGPDHPVVEFLQGLYRNGKRLADFFTTYLLPTLGNFVTLLTGGDFENAGTILSNIGEKIVDGWNKTVGAWLEEIEKFGATLLSRMVEGFQGLDWSRVSNQIPNIQQWLRDRASEANIFGAQLLQDAVNSMKGLNWDVLKTDVKAGFNSAWANEVLFKEPNWRKMWDDTWANTQKEFEILKNIDQWTANNLGSGNLTISGDNLRQKGIQLGRDLWINTLDELQQISELGRWVVVEIDRADWEKPFTNMTDKGREIAGGLISGMGEKLAGIESLINGGGGPAAREGATASLGERLLGALNRSFAAVKQQIADAGAAPFQWLFGGMKSFWDQNIQPWLDSLGGLVSSALAALPGGGQTATKPGKTQQEMHDLTSGGQAFGGLSRGGWTWVGEAGKELVKLPPGAMVIPHGASLARAMTGVFPGMAQGGISIPDWWQTGDKTWMKDLLAGKLALMANPDWAGQGTAAERALRREIKAIRDIIQGLRGDGGASGGGAGTGTGHDRASGVAGLSRHDVNRLYNLGLDDGAIDRYARLLARGMSHAEAMARITGTAHSGGGGGQESPSGAGDHAARAADRLARAADRAGRGGGGRSGEAPVDTTATDRAARLADRRDARIAEQRPGHGGNVMSFQDFQRYKKASEKENRQNEIPPMNFYGPVNILAQTADIQYEITRTLSSQAR